MSSTNDSVQLIDYKQFYETELDKYKLKNTCKWLTNHEKAKVLGLRATQIQQNNPPLIHTKLTDPLLIAEEELKQGKIPFIIKRNLPNNNYELVKITDLIILN